MARVINSVAIASTLLALTACTGTATDSATEPTASDDTLTIFWNQGFYPEEDLALQEFIADWEAESGVEVEINLYSSDDILNQATVALENGNPPDILFAHRADYTLQPQWAWSGQLADVTDIVEPYQDEYTPAALEAAYLYNSQTGDRSYYGVPIEQQTIHLHYWRDLLTEAGLDEAQIPADWQGFWDFWRQAQDTTRKAAKPDIYGLGLTLSTQGSDTYYFFEQVMDAYDVELFDGEGNFQGDDPTVRSRLIEVLDWTAGFYANDYVPDDAVTWLDSDNNVQFLNQAVLMTPNPSLSIPASQREDEALYREKIVTRPFPDEPDGEPMRYLVTIKQAVIFSEARNPEAAKEFLRYLIEPERLNTYVKGSLGRWFPAMESSLSDPFWADPADPHIAVAVQQFTQSPTRPFYHAVNAAYAQVQAENVWGQAIGRVVTDDMTSEQAVDEAIAQIQQILSEWEDQS